MKSVAAEFILQNVIFSEIDVRLSGVLSFIRLVGWYTQQKGPISGCLWVFIHCIQLFIQRF